MPIRPEIPNKLLFGVLEIWTPNDPGGIWRIDQCADLTWQPPSEWAYYDIRLSNNVILEPRPVTAPAIKAVLFALVERPSLGLLDENGTRKAGPPWEESRDKFKAAWSRDPWIDNPKNPTSVVNRMKSYEWLKDWAENNGRAITSGTRSTGTCELCNGTGSVAALFQGGVKNCPNKACPVP